MAKRTSDGTEKTPRPSFLRIAHENVKAAGLFPPADGPMILFCREPFIALRSFLEEALATRVDDGRRNNPHTLAWVLGPPGTGKSACALSFVLDIDTTLWSVTWFRITEESIKVFRRGAKGSAGAILDDDLAVRFELDERTHSLNTTKHLVVVDGVRDLTTSSSDSAKVLKVCKRWLANDYERRRLFVISSLSSRGKPNIEEDKLSGVKEFHMPSWTQSEYLVAAENADFFRSVESNLDAADTAEDTQLTYKERVESKYYFAGGSARFMFSLSTAEVIDLIKTSVESVEDPRALIELRAGHRSPTIVNRLFSSFVDPVTNLSYPTLVSQFAAVQLGIHMRKDVIARLISALGDYRHGSLDGWLFEAWFFASLHETGVEIETSYGDGPSQVWPKTKIAVKSLADIQPDAQTEFGGPVWVKPPKHNQGGYDAVCVDFKSGVVRFVQITIQERHAFKLSYFRQALDCLDGNKRWIRGVDVWFISPSGQDDVVIAPVEGSGALSNWGWPKGEEANQAKAGHLGWPGGRKQTHEGGN